MKTTTQPTSLHLVHQKTTTLPSLSTPEEASDLPKTRLSIKMAGLLYSYTHVCFNAQKVVRWCWSTHCYRSVVPTGMRESLMPSRSSCGSSSLFFNPSPHIPLSTVTSRTPNPATSDRKGPVLLPKHPRTSIYQTPAIHRNGWFINNIVVSNVVLFPLYFFVTVSRWRRRTETYIYLANSLKSCRTRQIPAPTIFNTKKLKKLYYPFRTARRGSNALLFCVAYTPNPCGCLYLSYEDLRLHARHERGGIFCAQYIQESCSSPSPIIIYTWY